MAGDGRDVDDGPSRLVVPLHHVVLEDRVGDVDQAVDRDFENFLGAVDVLLPKGLGGSQGEARLSGTEQ